MEEIEPYMLRTGSQVLQELEIRGSVKRIANYAFCSEYDFNYNYNHNGYNGQTTASTVLRIQEGVESKKQLDIASSCGADLIQGFYFSKPIPKDDFFAYLHKEATAHSA